MIETPERRRTKSVDLFVIDGSGGVVAARIAATYGANVASAEEYRMGAPVSYGIAYRRS
jgi:pyruvate/2-oxoglutarate dehydrogenase complex dihydrolipoamide dehydrogenase (E3) component